MAGSTEADVDEVLREIRLALLEADVNINVVRSLRRRGSGTGCVGAELSKSLRRASRSSRSSTTSWSPILGGERSRSPTPSGRRPSSCWPACRARARRPPPPSWPAGSSSRAATRCSSAPTSNAPPPSSSSGCSAARPASRLQRADRPGGGGRGRSGRGPAAGPGRPDRRHRRSSRHRRRPDGRGPRASPSVEPHYTFLVIDAMTGQDAVSTADGLPRRPWPSTASSSPSWTATPGAAPPCRSRRWWAGPSPSPRPVRNSTTSTSSTRTAWPTASSGWATCSA